MFWRFLRLGSTGCNKSFSIFLVRLCHKFSVFTIHLTIFRGKFFFSNLFLISLYTHHNIYEGSACVIFLKKKIETWTNITKVFVEVNFPTRFPFSGNFSDQPLHVQRMHQLVSIWFDLCMFSRFLSTQSIFLNKNLRLFFTYQNLGKPM